MADVIWQTEEYRDLIMRRTAATDALSPRMGVVDIHGDATATSLLMRSNGTTTTYVFGGQPFDAVYDMFFPTTFAVRFVTTIGGTEYTIDGSAIKQIGYESSSVAGSTFSFGDFIGKTADMTVFDMDGDYDEVSFEGAVGVLSYGVKRSNNDYYWVSMGTFMVDDSKRLNSTVWLSFIDAKSNFDFVHTGTIGANQTLFQLAQAACTSAGITLGTVVGDLPNGTTVVTNSATIMTVSPLTTDVMLVKYIAQATGTFAVIGRDNKLYFRWYEEVSPRYSIERKLISIGQSVADYEITTTGVSWTATDGTKYTSGTSTYQLDVTNNPFTFANYATLLTGIASNVVGFVYSPIDFKWVGDPALDVGDIIVVPDKKGNMYSVPITSIKNRNTLSQSIKSAGESHLVNSSVSAVNSVTASIDDVRTIATFGEVLASRVTTGKLQSSDGSTYFDLDGSGTLHTDGEIEAIGFTGSNAYCAVTASFENLDFNAQLSDLYIDGYDPIIFHATHNRASYDTTGTSHWNTDSYALNIQLAMVIIGGKIYKISGSSQMDELATPNDIYPVGTVYYTVLTSAQFSPVTKWGGSWTYAAGTPNSWRRTA